MPEQMGRLELSRVEYWEFGERRNPYEQPIFRARIIIEDMREGVVIKGVHLNIKHQML